MRPAERIHAYFDACSRGTADDIASHFNPEAVIFDSNVRPVRGSVAIGQMWVKVRDRWAGAVWAVDSMVSQGSAAAIEWSMTGADPSDRRLFVFHGSEHYQFDTAGLIEEIRQYWTFDPVRLDTGLIGYAYPEPQ